MAYIAKTKITVKGKTYKKDEVIKEKMSERDSRFLLREGYIVEEEKKTAGDHAASAKAASK